MVKIYQRYANKSSFGLINTLPCNVIFDGTGKLVISAALEQILIWSIRRGVVQAVLKEDNPDRKKQAIVTQLCLSPNKKQLAAGYANGSIKIWSLTDNKIKSTFKDHRSEITTLCFNKSGSLLASGSKDTDIVVWDIVAETGLYRLRGHKNAITDLKFLEQTKALVSCSKDTFLKVWDLQTQHCVQTVIGHRSEIWSLDVNADETRLATVAVDQWIRVYKVASMEEIEAKINKKSNNATNGTDQNADGEQMEGVTTDTNGVDDLLQETEPRLVHYGNLDRKAKERGSLIRFNADSTYLACQAAGKSIEFYRVNDVEKINKKLRNRKRKEEEKRKQAGSADDEEITIELTAREEFSVKGILRTPHKIQSFCFPSNAETKEFLVASVDNSIELYQQGDKNYEKLSSLESPGHRADIRSLALSSADEMLLSTSRDLVKVWNVNTRTCIRTIESGYGICGLFVPGDRHVVIGTKTGKIEIYDLQSARCLEVVDAHAGPVWSLTLKPDQTGFLSGSSDKTLKMWDFELVNDAENKGNKRLTINSSQTVEMSAEVLCAKFSRDGKYVAVSLLDSTVKIFFTDSMKFYLSLFGHKLPVNSLDISDDNALIITGSADKDIKIWGMDFGDCHKSIFAHDDAVTQVIFVPQTHYFFSCGKDGLVKYWDGDKWELIHTLEGHHDKVWAMTLSSQGDMLFTGAADRSIRLWERTNEQMVLDSEREQEREEMWDATLEDEDRYQKEEKEEVGKASVQTLESVKSAEKLMEALAIASKELQNAKDYQQALIEAEKRMSKEEIAKLKAQNQPLLAPPVPHEDLKGQSPSEYVLGVVRSIRSAELEEALLMLTFTQVTDVLITVNIDLLRFLNEWVIVGKHIELCARCTFFLVKTHNSQISSTKSLLDTLHSLKENTRKQLQKVKDVIGFNKAAMNHLKRDLESSISTDIFDSAAKFEEVQKRKKQKTGHNYWE